MKEDSYELDSRQVASLGWLSRDRALAIVLIAATAIAVYLCYLLIVPFLPAIAWALALGLVAYPTFGWLSRRMHSPNLAASITVLLVALVIIVPTVLLAQQLVVQMREGVTFLTNEIQELPWSELLDRYPRLAPAVKWFEKSITPGDELKQVTSTVTGHLTSLFSGSLWVGTQVLITLYILFYCIRDRHEATRVLRSLVPLSDRETDEVFNRVEDTVFATIYGTVVVGLVQGVFAWALFFVLGLPGALLWGALTAVLGVVPVLGPFVIWIPASIILAVQGDVRRAVIVTVGGIVIALVGHFMYPALVGHRLRLHPVMVFFAFIGGLAVFGMAGLILGPAVLALTEALFNVWQRRTAEGRPGELRPAS